jgi:ATP-dependent RNA helicase DOB1
MDKIFKELRTKAGAEKIINKYVGELFEKGGTDFSTLEVLAHIKESYPSLFEKYEQRILVRLGLFFKNPKITTFEDSVFKIYKEHIEKTYKESFTPIQADVISKINRSKFFSFSSPTSTGKSYIFRYLISTLKNDMAIIVPSRALINEYCKLVTEIINDKTVNVLTFVDKINTKRATRNIFIITPERTKDLFTMRNEFNIGMILFDEAQLSDDKGIRGMYYDSVIRRAIKYFQTSKFVFAYPFIKNPEGQFRRNSITTEDMVARKYDNKNVGQIFYLCQENKKNRSTNDFYKFGISQALFGNKIVAIDPLKEVLDSNGVALIFCSKESIKQGRIFKKFASYIDQKSSIKNTEALGIIDEIRTYIGASGNNYTDDYWSSMVHNMRKGIVIHHGSLPLRVRILIEKFVNSGYCKICFATATLEQGINMPFDLVWIERWSGHSTIIDNKNLIGRAGRSSNLPKFDYGKVVTKNMTKMRAIVNEEIFLETVSQLDRITDEDDDYKDYKEAIRNGTFSEEYNLANTEIERLKERRTIKLIDSVLESLFDKDGKVHFENLKGSEEVQGTVEEAFIEIYEHYLNRRLGTREREILSTTVKILFWRVQNKRFNEIVQKRYSFAAQTWNRRLSSSDAPSPRAGYLVRYDMIPLKKERRNAKVPSLTAGLNASEVDYDAIVTDTYDFIDKLIGFRVGDVYIAAFDLYSKNEKNDINLRAYAKSITNLIRYGTDDKKEIWMLRYGFDFEDFEWLSPLIMSINQDI